MSGIKLHITWYIFDPPTCCYTRVLMVWQGDERSTSRRAHYRDPVVKGMISARPSSWIWKYSITQNPAQAPPVPSIQYYRKTTPVLRKSSRQTMGEVWSICVQRSSKLPQECAGYHPEARALISCGTSGSPGSLAAGAYTRSHFSPT
jgi:hypothetical protein